MLRPCLSCGPNKSCAFLVLEPSRFALQKNFPRLNPSYARAPRPSLTPAPGPFELHATAEPRFATFMGMIFAPFAFSGISAHHALAASGFTASR